MWSDFVSSNDKNKEVELSKKTAKSNAKDSLVSVNERKVFYKDQYTVTVKLLAASVVCAVVSLGGLFLSISKQSNNVYFAVNPDNTLIKLIPLNEPNQKDSVVSNWTANSLRETFDFSYYNAKEHLNKVINSLYTEQGGQQLLTHLKETGNMDAIFKNKLLLSLTVDNTPLVVKKGDGGGTVPFRWMIEVQATISFRTESSVYTNKVLMSVIVSRTSLLSNPDGLGISSIVMEVID